MLPYVCWTDAEDLTFAVAIVSGMISCNHCNEAAEPADAILNAIIWKATRMTDDPMTLGGEFKVGVKHLKMLHVLAGNAGWAGLGAVANAWHGWDNQPAALCPNATTLARMCCATAGGRALRYNADCKLVFESSVSSTD